VFTEKGGGGGIMRMSGEGCGVLATGSGRMAMVEDEDTSGRLHGRIIGHASKQ
jgi:hypothetical protein